MYKNRIITNRLKKLFATFPVVVVSGARQVGKSTLLKHVFPDLEAVLFDPSIDIGAARQEPDIFLDNHPAPLILDEIQYAGELVSAIKRRVDQNRRPGMYLLTGSQQWSVLKTISESLAGRAVFLTLEGFSLSEIGTQADRPSWLERWLEDTDLLIRNAPERLVPQKTLYEHLWTGWFPEANTLGHEMIPDFYRGYLQTYIERDARVIHDVLDWQQFGRFVQLVGALTAQEINYSQLGRDLGITTQTAKRWVSTLTATFQWQDVFPYSGNTIKRISGRPKGYMADTGLVCHLQMITSPKALSGHPLTGALFETAVVGQIRKHCGALATAPRFYHWRVHSGPEVDLILERDGILFPIEIKLTTNPSRKDTSGITAFRKTYPQQRIAPGLVIAPCPRFERISDHDYALPWDSI
jgi:predicted AAA+ superfamily ATPase